MKQKWNFINSGKCTAAFNMALDEALLKWHSEGKIGPVIRFYGWEPATLSIGYFQKVDKEINLKAVEKYRLGFVRRPTGGRGVLHEHELTYSVIVSETNVKIPKGVTESYRVISEGVLEGFKQLGLTAYFAVPKTKEEEKLLRNPHSAVCFDAPSWYELVVEGKKVAGSAQMRQNNVILQHGAILMDIDERKLVDIFKFSNERVRERFLKQFGQKAVTINKLLKRNVAIEEVEAAFKCGFETALNIELQTYTLSETEKDYVNQLAISRYENNDWNFSK